MDIHKQKFTRLQNEMFRLLSIYSGKPLSQRQIAQFLCVSPMAISKSLPALENENFLVNQNMSSMNINLIELNRDNPEVIQKKRLENLQLLFDSGLTEFLEETFPASTIILFGSFSLGEDTIDSDIDIAIIGAKEKDVDTETYEHLLKRQINLQFFSDFSSIVEHLKSNILNGITLSGYVDL